MNPGTRLASKRLVMAFVESINAHSVDRLAKLMSVEHVFVDSLGNRVKGREAMQAGWRNYFDSFPDYKISVTDVFSVKNTFVLLGVAEGTFSRDGKLLPKNRWKIPAAWKAVVENGRIAEWRVFADNYKTAMLLKRS